MKTNTEAFSDRSAVAFTLIELAALFAAAAILSFALLPASARSGRQSDASQCLSNHKQLSQAWFLYCVENGDRTVGNVEGRDAQTASNSNLTWCVGWLDFTGGLPSGGDTNINLIRNSRLGKYASNVNIYKCPSDKSLNYGKKGNQRVRSVSMNSYIGAPGPFGQPYTPGYVQFTKLTDLSFHPPSQTFVFADEREDSIDDGWFALDMAGYDPQTSALYTMPNFPGAYHNRGGTFSFADGRVEIHRWTDPRTTPSLRVGIPLAGGAMPGNGDIDWLQDHSTFKATDPTR
jgi:prepilin-type processing-associated H-X9-DG protein